MAESFFSGPVPSTEGGDSGYLSDPAHNLDPDLFNGMTMRPEVRMFILDTLTEALARMGLKDIRDWLYLWVIGSSMSYQWAEQVGHGDIDVTFAADITKFLQANPHFAVGAEDAATKVKQYIKANVAPGTSRKMFGGHAYEVTFFWNPDVTNGDLGQIHPYAAYDIIKNEWTVEPVKLPAHPASLYPREWFDRADNDLTATNALTRAYDQSSGSLDFAHPSTPGHINALARIKLVASQAQALYDEIHNGRMEAFSGSGAGYGDWHNFRWQRGKGSGTIKGLSEILGPYKQYKDAEESRLYGAPLEGADELIRRAQQRYL
jgi:hypothetical protein